MRSGEVIRVQLGSCEVRGLVVSVPATRSARPGFESRPGASSQGGLRGGRSHCEYFLIKYGNRRALKKKINHKENSTNDLPFSISYYSPTVHASVLLPFLATQTETTSKKN